MRSESSRTQIDLSSSIQSWVLVAICVIPPWGLGVSEASGAGGRRGGAAADQTLVDDLGS